MDNHRFSSDAGEAIGHMGETSGQVLAFPRPCHRQAEGEAPAVHDATPVDVPLASFALDVNGRLCLPWLVRILDRARDTSRIEAGQYHPDALAVLYYAHAIAATAESIMGRAFSPRERHEFAVRVWPQASEIASHSGAVAAAALTNFLADTVRRNRPAPKLRSLLHRLVYGA